MTRLVTPRVPTPADRPSSGRAPADHAPQPEGGSAAPAPEAEAFSPEQMQAIAIARQQARRISRAGAIAAFSGWTLAIFAAITLLCGLFSLSAFLLGLGLAVVAWRELGGSRGLRMFDLAAPHRLGWNQVALGVMIIAYAGWSILSALTGASPYEAHLASGGPVAEALAPIDRLQRVATVLFYAVVIAFSILTQGGLSAYYFTRRRHLAAYLSSTPPRIVDMLRVAAA